MIYRKVIHPIDTPVALKYSSIFIRIFILIIAATSLFPINISGADSSDIFVNLEASKKELQSRVEKAGRSIVHIITYDDAGFEIARGSGLFIDTSGRIITNASIINNAYSAGVYSGSNHYEQVVVLNQEKAADLALLKVEAINEKPLELALETLTAPGKRVVAVGKLSGSQITVTEGIIKTISDTAVPPELIEVQTTMPLLSYKPSKDGPLLDVEGKVVGIVTDQISYFKDKYYTPWGYYNHHVNAVSIRSVASFLSTQDNVRNLHPQGSKIWSRWILRQVKKKSTAGFIVLYSIGFFKFVAVICVFIALVLMIRRVFNKLKVKFNK